MSTFKQETIYAEILLGWCDVAYDSRGDIPLDEVVSRVEWVFKGGTLGDYPRKYHTDHSTSTWPNGPCWEMGVEFSHKYGVLRALLAERRAFQRKKVRARRLWGGGFVLSACKLDDVNRTLGKGTRIVTGLRAVYRVLRAAFRNRAVLPVPSAWSRFEEYAVEAVVAGVSPTLGHVQTHIDLVARTVAFAREAGCGVVYGLLLAALRLIRLSKATRAGHASHRLGSILETQGLSAAMEAARSIGADQVEFGGLKFYCLRNCVVGTVNGRVVTLGSSDLVRLHQFVSGVVSGLYATVCQAVCAPGPTRDRVSEVGASYMRQVDRILAHSENVGIGDEVHVCKVFKRAFGAYQGILAGPICDTECEVLHAETRDTEWAAKSDWEGWIEECRRWDAFTAFNIGKVYKLCPAPDASPAYAFLDRHEVVCNANTMDPSWTDRFRNDLRTHILRALVRKPGLTIPLRDESAKPVWYADYLRHEFDSLPSSEFHAAFAWEGCLSMPVRSPLSPGVWKDSGCGWDTYEASCDPDRNPRHANMITRMIFDKNVPQPDKKFQALEHTHKVGDKFESHKDPARVYYSANLGDRFDQSVMEVAVESVARYHPSFMIGASTVTKAAKVTQLLDRCYNAMFCDFYYSFDISGWSPKMASAPQLISHEIWADLFDSDLFRKASHINEGARVMMDMHGYKGWYINPSANFEGFNGKEMTCILISLMSLAVYEFQRLAVDLYMAIEDEAKTWAASLLAYIDDGLGKLRLPRDRYVILTNLLKATTADVFGKCGYTLEWSKCYPSDVFSIFLNEPYVAGRHIMHGTKAAMTLCAENVEEHTTLIERTTAVTTGARGAAQAGLDPLPSFLLQTFHVFRHIDEWVGKESPILLALWSHTPRAWGGLGVPNMLQLMTSGGGSTFEESVATLQNWARHSKSARKVYLTLARRSLKARTARSVLTSGLGGGMAEGVIAESRVAHAIRKSLEFFADKEALSDLAQTMLSMAGDDAFEAYAQAVVPLGEDEVLQEQILSTSKPYTLTTFSPRSPNVSKSLARSVT